MNKVTATLEIELNVECPYCKKYIDLLSPTMGLNDEGEIIKQACPKDKLWHDSHIMFKKIVICPDCQQDFKVEGIEW